MSGVSGRAGMSSPWDPISPGSSRRSSEAGARGAEAGARVADLRGDHGARMSPVMSHHLSKLHKKALVAGTNSSLLQVYKHLFYIYKVVISVCLSVCLIVPGPYLCARILNEKSAFSPVTVFFEK